MNFFNNLKVGQKIIAGNIVTLIFLVSIVAVLLSSLINLTESFTFLIEHDQPVLSNAYRLEKSIVDMETGQRGFLITGKDEFLEPYNNGVNKFDALLETEKNLVSDNPHQIVILEKLGQLHDEWLEKSGEPEIAKRREVNKATVSAKHLQEVLKVGVGKGILDELRQVLDQLETNLTVKDDLKSVILTIKIAKNMVDQETGQRGFLITGDENFLEPYHNGKTQLITNIAALRTRLTGDLDNFALLTQIESLATQWIEKAAKPEIGARQEMNANPITMNDVSAIIQAGTGKSILDMMRTQFNAFIQTENQLNAQRASAAKQEVVRVETLTLSLTLGGIIIGLLLVFAISRSITRPLASLTNMANKMAIGDMSQMLNAQTRNEIHQITQRRDEMGNIGRAFDTLTLGFNKMIEDIVQVSQGLATGNLSVMLQSEYQGDFVQIKQAQETALSNQRRVIKDIVQVSQGLSEGRLHVASQAIYQGDFEQIKEALEMALSNLREVVEDIVQVSQSLAEGTQNVIAKAEYQGDFVQIKNALETAATKLAETTTKNTTQDWFKTGQAQLNEQMSGEQEIATLAKNIICFLTTYIKAQVGLFYLLKEPKLHHQKPYLQVIAGYAYTASDNIPTEFSVGDGLVGQAALDKKPIYHVHIPEEYTPIIQSGMAKSVPRYMLMLPFLYENEVKGVIEIGSTHALTDNQRNFLEQVIPGVGIVLNTAESRTKMRELLAQSQQQTEELQSQSEELQSQQEEMQQINEELQHQREQLQHKQEELQQRNEVLQNQSEELQTQAEELQTQQEELRQTNEALEERSKELEQQKQDVQHNNIALEKTQHALEFKLQELELASQYKSEFLANMSHELRTPLNSLLILSQLLSENKDGNLSDKQVEYAKTVHSAGSDLLTLINDILDLSKVEAGKMEIQVEELSLPDLVEAMEQKFRPVADKKSVAFSINISDDLPLVLRTDVQRLKQIINNLLSNAFKFTDQGEVKLTIQCPSDDLSVSQQKGIGRNFAISISDSGIGIPIDKQKVIFEAFQQVDGTTSRRYGGTGLGLSISRQLARLLGGEIHLHSEEGKGSTFTFYLPAAIDAKEATPQTTEIVSTTDDKALIHQTTEIEPLNVLSAEKIIDDDRKTLKPEDKSLLIIEDDSKFSGILMELARGQDFKCLLAEDGRTGLQLAEEYKPNAIILDAGLPQLDGWTVMDKLKDNPDTRHIPVHFISASDQGLMAKKMGAIGFLHKPVSMEQIGEAFKRIEQFLNQTVKNLLVIVDSEPHQQKILELVSSENVEVTLAVTITIALQHLKTKLFDCIILDMEVEQGSGRQILEKMDEFEGLCQTPFIIYTKRDLTSAEEALLLQCAERLPVKSVKSPERLLDETTLFLHQLESNLPKEKRNMLKMVHDKEAILKDKKVLIVDDDMRNVFALATVLEDKGMEVAVAQNGKEGLSVLEKHEDIAIVLMDIMMPEMDGYEAMQEIRKQRRYRELPIIALTAKAMKGDKSKCIKAGANDYLSKPVDTEKLISLMRVWLYR